MTPMLVRATQCLLTYDPNSGYLLWKDSPLLSPQSRARLVGRRAGMMRSNGHVVIKIQGKRILAQRLAWILMLGVIPKQRIKHKNGVLSDNRWNNLTEDVAIKASPSMKGKVRNDLSAKFLRSILEYNKKTGVFKWRWRKDLPLQWNRRYVGQSAGIIVSTTGRKRICIYKRSYSASRLAWLFVTGLWPKAEIDHKKGILGVDKDNRFSNLREATRSQNACNQKVTAKNTSGYKGVVFNKRRKKWVASITTLGVQKYIGQFVTAKAASVAYAKEADVLHKEFANTNRHS